MILVETTRQHSFFNEKPQRLIGYQAYHSDPLDQQLA